MLPSQNKSCSQMNFRNLKQWSVVYIIFLHIIACSLQRTALDLNLAIQVRAKRLFSTSMSHQQVIFVLVADQL